MCQNNSVFDKVFSEKVGEPLGSALKTVSMFSRREMIKRSHGGLKFLQVWEWEKHPKKVILEDSNSGGLFDYDGTFLSPIEFINRVIFFHKSPFILLLMKFILGEDLALLKPLVA